MLDINYFPFPISGFPYSVGVEGVTIEGLRASGGHIFLVSELSDVIYVLLESAPEKLLLFKLLAAVASTPANRTLGGDTGGLTSRSFDKFVGSPVRHVV